MMYQKTAIMDRILMMFIVHRGQGFIGYTGQSLEIHVVKYLNISSCECTVGVWILLNPASHSTT